MRPYIPRKVSASVDRISAPTWNQLIDCLEYAMRYPRGDGITIRNTEANLLTALPSGAGGGNGGGAGIQLAAVVTMPTSGGDYGTLAPLGIGSGGAITPTSGASIPARFIALDGYN